MVGKPVNHPRKEPAIRVGLHQLDEATVALFKLGSQTQGFPAF